MALDNFKHYKIKLNRADMTIATPLTAKEGAVNGNGIELQIINGSILEDTTNVAWRVDLSTTTAANKICMVTKLVDATGDTNGRVVFKILKSLADTSASGYFINNVRVN